MRSGCISSGGQSSEAAYRGDADPGRPTESARTYREFLARPRPPGRDARGVTTKLPTVGIDQCLHHDPAFFRPRCRGIINRVMTVKCPLVVAKQDWKPAIMLIIKIMYNVRQQIDFHRNGDLFERLSLSSSSTAEELRFQGGENRFANLTTVNVHCVQK